MGISIYVCGVFDLNYRRMYDVLHESDEKRIVQIKTKSIWELFAELVQKFRRSRDGKV